MIHVNSRTGHEILTEEEFAEKHPALAAALKAPRPFKEQGEELKRIRQEADMSLREMAQMTGRKLADLSSIEHGRTEITDQIRTDYRMAALGYIKPAGQELSRDRYPLLYQAIQEEHSRCSPAPGEAIVQQNLPFASKQHSYRNPKSDDELYPEAVEWAKQHAEDAAIGLYQRFFIPYHSAEQMLKRLVADGHVVEPIQPGGCYQPAPGNGTLLSDRKLSGYYLEAIVDMMENAEVWNAVCARHATTEARDAFLFDRFKAVHQAYAKRPRWEYEEWMDEAKRRGIEIILAQRVWDTYHLPF